MDVDTVVPEVRVFVEEADAFLADHPDDELAEPLQNISSSLANPRPEALAASLGAFGSLLTRDGIVWLAARCRELQAALEQGGRASRAFRQAFLLYAMSGRSADASRVVTELATLGDADVMDANLLSARFLIAVAEYGSAQRLIQAYLKQAPRQSEGREFALLLSAICRVMNRDFVRGLETIVHCLPPATSRLHADYLDLVLWCALSSDDPAAIRGLRAAMPPAPRASLHLVSWVRPLTELYLCMADAPDLSAQRVQAQVEGDRNSWHRIACYLFAEIWYAKVGDLRSADEMVTRCHAENYWAGFTEEALAFYQKRLFGMLARLHAGPGLCGDPVVHSPPAPNLVNRRMVAEAIESLGQMRATSDVVPFRTTRR